MKPDERWQLGNTEDPVFEPQPKLPNVPTGPSSPIQSPVKSVTATSKRWECSIPVCPELFGRRIDRDRHELAHLPYFLHCPVAGCPKRGNRPSDFKKHWREQGQDPSHSSYRKQHGDTLEQSQETFDPQEILDRIKKGTISLTEGQEEAVLIVQVKSFELEKLGMMTEPWGRNRKLQIG